MGPFAIAGGPKLVAVVVVDQMRADYLQRYANDYKFGLKRLTDGTVYTNAHLNHVPTETGPGHATIATGEPPGKHGIIANHWYDRDAKKIVNCIDDPDAGVGPAQLTAPTLGDVMKSTSPLSHAVSVSYKDRAAVLLAGKKADLVLWYNEKSKSFTSSSAYPTPGPWLDAFNTTKEVRAISTTTATLDRATLNLVKEAMKEAHLGEDDICDLLNVSFSATDLVGHKYGPDSPQMKQQLLVLDAVLGDLIDYLSAKTAGNFLIAFTSDHGVNPIPEKTSPPNKRLMGDVLDKRIEDACQRVFSVPKSSWTTIAFIPDVYLNRELVKQKGLDWGSFLIRLSLEWRKIPDVAAVYLNNPLISQDKFGDMYQRSYVPGRSGDLFIRMKQGILLTDRKDGTTHGTPYEDDTHVPLIFYGVGFSKRTDDKPTTNEIIAPTLARFIGIDFY